MALTAKARRALEIVRDYGPIYPREFAHRMWPDAPGWRVVVRCGAYGSTRGRQMVSAGGAFLGKLRKQGYAWPGYERLGDGIRLTGWVLTQEGREILRRNTEEQDG